MKITHFLIDNPKRANAFSLEVAQSLAKALSMAEKSGQDGFIVASKSARVFCAGGDLQSYAKMKKKSEGVEINRMIRQILSSLKKKPFLVAAAIEGDVLGGGCELALACDFIVVSENCRFSFRHVAQSLTLGWGGGKNLLQRVRPSVALDWLTSGRWIEAQEAYQEGLADVIVAPGTCLEGTEDFLERRGTPLAGEFKKLVYSGGVGEETIFDKLWFSKSHQEAVQKTLLGIKTLQVDFKPREK